MPVSLRSGRSRPIGGRIEPFFCSTKHWSFFRRARRSKVNPGIVSPLAVGEESVVHELGTVIQCPGLTSSNGRICRADPVSACRMSAGSAYAASQRLQTFGPAGRHRRSVTSGLHIGGTRPGFRVPRRSVQLKSASMNGPAGVSATAVRRHVRRSERGVLSNCPDLVVVLPCGR